MTETTIRWGILGAGGIARTFAKALPSSRTGVLQAVAARDADRAAGFAREFGGATSYGSYDELLADDSVDAVYISTVHTTHASLAVRAAEAGKHVLCEKPMTMNAAETMAVVEAARRTGVILIEAFAYRFLPQTTALLDLVRSGAIGDVRSIEVSRTFNADYDPEGRLFDPAVGGGAMLDIGCYPASLVRIVAGAALDRPFADPVTVEASGVLGDTGVDEFSVASLTFGGGITASIGAGIRVEGDANLRVLGSRGILDLPDPWLVNPGVATIRVSKLGHPTETIEIEQGNGYAAEADAIADALAGDSIAPEAPEMLWADSIGNARLLDSWREALGLEYPTERADADIPSISGAPLRRADDAVMPYGRIADIGKDISRLILGCDNQRTLPHATVMFDDFFTRGGNAFDTGYIYGGGLMERLLGQWVANRNIRDDVVIIGKGAHTPHCNPEALSAQLLESLDRLQTDHLDLYLMHRDNTDIPVADFVDVLDEHQRAGRVRAFGGSNWTIDRYEEANRYARRTGKHGFVALSNHFGLARAHDVPWAGCEHVTDPASRAWLERNDVPLLPWSSQARGFFTGRARPDDTSDAELVRCYYSDENFERLRRARELGEQRGVQATAIALAYVLSQSFPTFALFGPRSLDETRVSMEGLRVSLSEAERDWLDLRADTLG
ncbi:aldo/keto reductase [Planctomonas psychrotolerans]|uniref:aldo/keto reductase n=1 Tax=Planctomonas psychrotolerans TaxID=2528712 RepID=UPI00123AB5C2|nr:aldo/keto reductase [Planctomonas psychrotolerans]